AEPQRTRREAKRLLMRKDPDQDSHTRYIEVNQLTVNVMSSSENSTQTDPQLSHSSRLTISNSHEQDDLRRGRIPRGEQGQSWGG
ncbi:hypothetical protein KUCAC02_036705, partial [Chaenocephalus aceratus]